MTEKISIIFLSLIFLGVFIARNIMVKNKVNQRIRSSGALLKASIILTTLCVLIAIISVLSDPFYRLLGAILFFRTPVVSYVGLSLFAASIIAGWFISAHLQDPWRVGIHEDQRTNLIQSGVFIYVRNPYFLSYFVMFFSLFLIRPSLLLMVLIAITVTIFHRMVLKEEIYLLKLHGDNYLRYREMTDRYIPRFLNRRSKEITE
jgi:protein-S-isoprenylcysteine O-methyltransferase Ste14